MFSGALHPTTPSEVNTGASKEDTLLQAPVSCSMDAFVATIPSVGVVDTQHGTTLLPSPASV